MIRAVAVLVALLLGGSLAGCARPSRAASRGHETSPALLVDVTRASGLDFAHSHGGSGRHYFVETMSGGCAFFDFDGDGWLDIFLPQGAPLPGYSGPGPLRAGLYRNDRAGGFANATLRSGVDVEMYAFGTAVGDYDNDGQSDLYVTALDGSHLFHNEGGGRFRDVTRRAGVAGRALATSAAWLDYDRDGWLDLFVCRYMEYELGKEATCRDPQGRMAYCSPHVYHGTHSLLFRNRGDGTFKDVTRASRLDAARGRSLGVACADFNGDGWSDLYVANDVTPNHLFLNQRDGTFREAAVAAGASHGRNGIAYAGMGVDCGDYDNDGDADLVCTNFELEPVSLFRNAGEASFSDESSWSGIGAATLPFLQWGCRFVDLDMDGSLDLFIASGHVDDRADSRGKSNGYAQPCQVLRNDGDGTFSDISARCGPFFARRQVARGAAFGDYDNDGDTDVLVACNNQPAILLRNETARRGNVVRLQLLGSGRSGSRRGCSRDALGARVTVTAGPTTQTQFVRSGGSYLADHDRRLLFAVGADRRATAEVQWPCGAIQYADVPAGELSILRESRCRAARRPN